MSAFSDGVASVTADPAAFNISPESVSSNWASPAIVRTNAAAISQSATASLPISVVLKETDLTPGALSLLASSTTLNPTDLKIQVVDQYTGNVLASTHPGAGVALLSLSSLTSTPQGAVIQATGSYNAILNANEQSRHFLMRTIVSGSYYNYTSQLENTFVAVSRPSTVLSAVTDQLSSNSGTGISGIATDIQSTSSLSNRLLSAEFTGSIPSLSGTGSPVTGNYYLQSQSIDMLTVSRIDTNADSIVDYTLFEVYGVSNVSKLDRPVVDPITGQYDSSPASSLPVVASNVRFRARFIDYDVALNEPLNGVYGSFESRNAAGANGSQVDLADLVVYRPGTTSNAWISSDGYDPVKFSLSSPSDPTNPLNPYQPNVLM